MTLLLVTGLVAVLLAGPGWLVAAACGVRGPLGPAVAPAIGAAVVMAVARLLDLIGAGVTPRTLGTGVLGVCAVAIVLAPRRPGRAAPSTPWRRATGLVRPGARTRPQTPRRTSSGTSRGGRLRMRGDHGKVVTVLGVGAGAVLGLLLWLPPLLAHATLPNWDAANHAYLTSRIADQGTVDPGQVVVDDPWSGRSPVGFYPLALHTVVATVHVGTGIGIPLLLDAVLLLGAALVLPLGTAVLVRHWAPTATTAPGVAAVAAVVVAGFPYKPIAWGGLPLVVGTACTFGVLVLVERVLRGPATARSVLATGLAVAGLMDLHSSEVYLLALLVLCGLPRTLAGAAGPVPGSRAAALGAVVGRAAGAGLVVLVLLLPVLAQVLGTLGTRSSFSDTPVGNGLDALGALLRLGYASAPQPWLAALAGVGVVVALVRRRALPAVAALGVLLVLFWLAVTSKGDLSRWATLAWYRQPERIAYHVLLLAPVFVGLAVDAAADLARRRPPPATASGEGAPDRPRAAPLLVVGAAVVAVVVAGFPGARATATGAFVGTVAVTDDDLAAFAWLGAHAGDGERVLNTPGDGSVWMATEGAAPMFSLLPAQTWDSPDWADRTWLRERVGDAGTDTRVAALLDHYTVRFVYLDDTFFDGSGPVIDRDALSASPVFTREFRAGGAEVYRYTP